MAFTKVHTPSATATNVYVLAVSRPALLEGEDGNLYDSSRRNTQGICIKHGTHRGRQLAKQSAVAVQSLLRRVRLAVHLLSCLLKVLC